MIRAAVENVANSSYWASAYNGVVTVGAPRTYLVVDDVQFLSRDVRQSIRRASVGSIGTNLIFSP